MFGVLGVLYKARGAHLNMTMTSLSLVYLILLWGKTGVVNNELHISLPRQQ
jgi:hypothetical protein